MMSLIGRGTLALLQETGNFVCFCSLIIKTLFKGPWYWRQVGIHLLKIGYFSLPVVGMTAVFTGMVLALQSYSGFSRFSAEGAVATVVVLSMTRELGPVLVGLMVTGRAGSSMAAEIASMRVTDQIDALITLSTPPLSYLVLPRVIAAVVMVPFLVCVADLIGVLGGYLVGIYQLKFNAAMYLHNTLHFLYQEDVISGLIKAMVFGGIIALVGTYCGYTTQKSARGVGNATTKSVVVSSTLILFTNYLLTALLFQR